MTSPTEQESAGARKRLAQYEARVAHVETERDSIASELAEARREIDRLRAMGRPFAEAVRRAAHLRPTEASYIVWCGVTWADFARTAELIPEEKP